MRPGPELAAESGAEEPRDDANVFNGNAKHLGYHVLRVAHCLGGLVEGEVLAIEVGHRGVELDGVMGLGGSGVGMVNLDRGGGKGRVGVAAMGVDAGFFRCFRLGEMRVHIEGRGLVGDLHGISGGDRLLEGEGNNNGDVLAVIADCVVFKGWTFFVDDAGEAGGRCGAE